MRVFFFFRSILDIIQKTFCLDNIVIVCPFLARKRDFLCNFSLFSHALSPARSGDHFTAGMLGSEYPVKRII